MWTYPVSREDRSKTPSRPTDGHLLLNGKYSRKRQNKSLLTQLQQRSRDTTNMPDHSLISPLAQRSQFKTNAPNVGIFTVLLLTLGLIASTLSRPSAAECWYETADSYGSESLSPSPQSNHRQTDIPLVNLPTRLP